MVLRFTKLKNKFLLISKICTRSFTMDIKTEVLAIIDDLFMEDASEMLDEDLYDAGILDSLGTVELIVHLEERFGIIVPVSELGREDWNTVNKIVAGIEGLRHG